MALLPGFYIAIWGASMFVAGLTFYWLALRIRQLWNGPPGILGFPFVGSSLRTNSGAIRRLFLELQDSIGSVYHLYIRSQYVVVVSDYSDFVRAFRENDRFLRGRHSTSFGTVMRSTPNPLRRHPGSFISADGTRWEIVSRFVRTTMYECIFDPDIIQLVSKSSKQLIGLLKVHPVLTRFGLQKLLGEAVLELVAALIVGVRYAQQPENISNLSRFMHSVDPLYATGSYSTKRFRTCGSEAKFLSNLKRVKADLKQEIWMQSRSKYQVSGTFCSTYLKHLDFVRKFVGRTIEKLVFSEEELINVAVDLFIASYFPLLRVLQEGILHLARQSAAQEKASREIRCAATSHFTATSPQEFGKNCPYATAIYCEILRLTSVAQPGACRKAVRAFQLGEYTVARDALVVADLEAIHRNEKQWTKPEDFRPDRFIDEAGVLRIPHSLVPFSIGERSCPGGHLSSVIIPRILIGLLTNFKITVERPPDGMSDQAQLLTFHPIESGADAESMSETSSTYL